MRVVAGSARGRRLVVPTGRTVRPTSDRVREATFNALMSLGLVEGATVLDLFAGSGAMGIEALSRGARRAVFVDRDRRALDAVRRNLDATGLDSLAQVVAGDALSWIADAEPADLVILDPPYRFDRWGELFAGVGAAALVIESDRSIATPDGWELVRDRRYGGTWVGIARFVSSGSS